MKGANTFKKQEKLKSRKLIQQVFSAGNAVNAHPLRIVFYTPAEPMECPVKIGVTASSRNFKKAVDRNRIKRLLREAYRLNKSELLNHAQQNNVQLAAFILYTDKVLPDFQLINDKMKVLLAKLIKATSEAAPKNS
jgi:ribonuclease P protein component